MKHRIVSPDRRGWADRHSHGAWMRIGALWILIVSGGLAMTGCSGDRQTTAADFETICMQDSEEESETSADAAGDGEETGLAEMSDEETECADEDASACEDDLDAVIYVYVSGCVADPGVYKMAADARVYEAIEAAGGMTAEASQTSINLAAVMEDQMWIYVPSAEEVESGTYDPDQYANTVTSGSTDTSGSLSLSGGSEDTDADSIEKVNLNTATLEELMELPGIGETKAASIITYREENGAFTSIEEIMNVSGIKEGIYETIKDLITV